MKKLMLIDDESGEERQMTNAEALDLVNYIIAGLPMEELILVYEVTKSLVLHTKSSQEFKDLQKLAQKGGE